MRKTHAILIATALVWTVIGLTLAGVHIGQKTTYEFCQGASVTWQGQTLTSSGEYYHPRMAVDTILNTGMLDLMGESAGSVVDYDTIHYFDTAIVHVHPVLADTDTVTILRKQLPYLWQGQTLTETGDYTAPYTSVHGCDSSYFLHLEVLNDFYYATYDEFCQSDDQPYYDWHGQHLTQSGIYYDNHVGINGLDSVFELHLTVHPSYRLSRSITLCEGSSVKYGDRTYTQSGRDTLYLMSQFGCDSIIYLSIQTDRSFHQYDTLRFTNRETRTWHGQTISKSGTYFDKYTSAITGCDSIYQLTAIVYQTYLIETNATICSNDTPYVWRGRNYSDLGEHTYEEHFTTTQGYDSIYRLNLAIHPVAMSEYRIDLCPGESAEYYGKTYREAGVYDIQRPSSHGCDSIVRLIVNVKDHFYRLDSIGINDNQSYTWPVNGVTYDKPGRYEHRGVNQQGCDSTYRLELYRNKKFYKEDTVKICIDNTVPTYHWHGYEISQSGVYWDSLHTVAGQDSVYKLYITFPHPTDTTIYMTVCKADGYEFGNMFVTESGNYVDTISNEAGCDSIIWLSITVIDNEEIRWDTVCDGDTIFWHGDTLTTENYYEMRVPDEHGCDSIFMMHLTMLYPFTHDSQDTICESHLLRKEPYLWGPNKRELWGKWNDETGHYEDSIYWNCDHTRYLHLHVLPERRHTDSITLCQGEVATRWTHTGEIIYLSEPGYYYDTIPSGPDHQIFACDSIVCFHVTVNPVYHDTIVHTYDKDDLPVALAHDAGTTITGPGYYTQSLHTIAGCDSIVVHAVSTLTRQEAMLCVGDSIDFHGTFIYDQGIYTYRFLHESGLDSTIQLTVNMMPSYHMTEAVHLSDQQNYTWRPREADGSNHDHVFTRPITSGEYTDTLRSVLGCDSVITLTLTVHPTYLMPDTIEVCQSELPYIWYDRQLTESGDYTERLKTATWGYDSIHTLHFQVLPTYLTKLSYVECAGTSIQFNHKVYDQPGLYRDTIPTVLSGCDSIFIIDLKWNDIYHTQLTDACDDKSLPYFWQVGNITRQLDHGGTYFETLQSTSGCDSLVELTLTVHQTYLFPENVRVCQSELPYQWRQQQLIATGVYEDKLTTTLGYDSIYQVHFTVLDTAMTDIYYEMCYGDTYLFATRPLREAGIYQDTLKTREGCDSIVTLHLKVLPKYATATQATVRQGTPYLWRGRELTQTGMYADTLKAANGCDSIITLELLVYDKEKIVDEGIVDVCRESLPYKWHGHYLTESKTYYDTVPGTTTNTIYIIQLRVQDMDNEIHEAVLCDGDYYEWRGQRITRDTLYQDIVDAGTGCSTRHTIYIRFRKPQTIVLNPRIDDQHTYTWDLTGQTYTQSGIYRHTIPTQDQQCDSIHYELHLQVTHYEQRTINLCHGEQYIYRDRVYDRDGTFADTIHTLLCDTVYTFDVRIFPTKKSFVTIDISDQETPYLWNGQSLTKAGQAIARLQTTEGCDSIVELNLRIHPTHYYEERLETCDNEPLTWHGKTYQQSGTYYDSLSTVTWGYDSIHALVLTVQPTYLIDEHVQIIRGATTTLHGIDISREGTYMDTLTSVHGCDSIYRITANYARSYRLEYNDTICNGETYTFYGRTYSRSETLTELLGPDSVEICHLTVLPKAYEEKRVVLFPGQLPYIYEGQPYEAGVHTFQLKTVQHNCDSVFRLEVVESQHYSDWDFVPLCTGSSIKVDSVTITEAGSYTFLYRSKVSGEMDSLYRIEVYNAPAYDLPVYERTICEGDTVVWNGKSYWRTGDYELRAKTREGCDSIAHLHLTVNPTYHFYEDATITDYESYRWRGNEYNTSGDYDRIYQTQEGCDSIYTLTLHVVSTDRTHQTDTICQGETYYWRGHAYTQSGIYIDTIHMPGSMTSSIYTLELSVTRPTIITTARTGIVCADADAMDIDFVYSGATPERYSVQFDSRAHKQGFVDVIDAPYTGHISIPMPTTGTTLYQDHTDYVRPDNYVARLVIDNGACGIAKSDSIQFTLRYPSWIIEQFWGDVVAPLKPALNGGYDFAQYEWYVNGAKADANGLGYLYTDQLHEGDQVVLYATRQGENYAIPTCPLTIERPTAPLYDHPVLVTSVAPTAAPHHMPTVTLRANMPGQWQLYDGTGHMVMTGSFADGDQPLTLPAIPGCYLLRTTGTDTTGTTHKLVIY